MPSYLANLYARNMLPAEEVENKAWLQPRLPSRFEPVDSIGGIPEPLPAQDLSATAPVRQPGDASSSHSRPVIGVVDRAAQPEARVRSPAPQNHVLAQGPVRLLRQMPVQNDTMGERPIDRTPQIEPESHPGELGHGMPIVQFPGNQDWAPVPALRRPAEGEQRPTTANGSVIPRQALPVSRTPAGRPAKFSDGPRSIRQPSEPAPVIQVSIGRVEVRAMPPPAPVTRPRPPYKPSGLDDYLKRRSKGQ